MFLCHCLSLPGCGCSLNQATNIHESLIFVKGFKYIIPKKKPAESRFALCIENRDCEDLEKRKIYQILPDEEAAREGYLRIVDESGEDYLYPESYFIVIELTRKAQEALAAAG